MDDTGEQPSRRISELPSTPDQVAPEKDPQTVRSDADSAGVADADVTAPEPDVMQQEARRPESAIESVEGVESPEDVGSNPEATRADENTDVRSDAAAYAPPCFDATPSLVYAGTFKTFTKGVKWAKDGVHFAVATDDNRVHVWRTADTLSRYDVPDNVAAEHAFTVREPQPINDFAWHPSHERSWLVTTCNTQPLHLYEASTGCTGASEGQLVCSYVAKNHLDELVAAYSVQFTKSGEKVCAGYKKFVRVFEVDYPGRWTEVSTWKQYQAGLVSALDADGENLLAVGTYCNSVALYDLRSGQTAHDPVVGHSGGVTQLRVSFDGRLLYSGARRDNVIQCRDVRNFAVVLHEFPRVCTTNQRMQFDLPYEEDFLCTGNTDGTCYVWNLRSLRRYDENKCLPSLIFLPHTDLHKTKSSAANGISFHPWAPLLASSSGGRSTTVWDDETERCVWTTPSENAVKLWKFTD